MSRPIDTPQRRTSIRQSPEVAAVRHLARAYGFSMRRRRRVGIVTFILVVHGADLPYGEARFSDTGHLVAVHLYGGHHGELSMLHLAEYLEYGSLVKEELRTQDLEAAFWDLNTGPVSLPVLAHAGVEYEPTSEPVALLTGVITLPLEWASPLTQSVPVQMVYSRPARPERAVTQDLVPDKAEAWFRFFLGTVLIFQAAWPFFLGALGGVPQVHWIAVSVVAAILGVVVVRSAIRAHDQLIATAALTALR